ncbi:MAG: hypothetical protein WDN10_00710 [bacterium]
MEKAFFPFVVGQLCIAHGIALPMILPMYGRSLPIPSLEFSMAFCAFGIGFIILSASFLIAQAIGELKD